MIMDDVTESEKMRLTTDREEIIAQDKRLRKRFGPLFDEALSILEQYDPIGIALVPGEYTPEVRTILPRLNEAHSPTELRHIIYEEFVKWFSVYDTALEEWHTTDIAGPEENYEQIAQQIWLAYQRYKKLGREGDARSSTG